jgi:integrase
MTGFVFRPKRFKNGKRVVSRLYSGRYRRPGHLEVITVPLHVSDQQVAEEKLRKLIRDQEREEMGLVVPKRVRIAAAQSFNDHVEAYCADLQARKRAAKYIAITERRLMKLAAECSWQRLCDVTPQSFQEWRVKQTLAAKTLNEYLATTSALFEWLKKTETVEWNPLKNVGKVEVRGNERRKRRAFTPVELGTLVSVAGRYRLALLMAYYTGLRRSELKQLEWADIKASDDGTFIVPRASTTKNHETKRLYLPSWFAAELMKARPAEASGNTRVFRKGGIPSMFVFQGLLKKARIAYKDAQGRQADFHALRRSLNTHLAQNSVDPHIRKEIMRHSELRLTLDVYTDKGMLPVAAAIEKLPTFLESGMNSHPCALTPDFSGQALASPGTGTSKQEILQRPEDECSRHALALTGASGLSDESGSRGRIRTYDQSVNSRPLYH